MRIRSLQGRLLLSSALGAVLVTALFGWAIAAVLERFVMQGLDGRLDAELTLMASAVDTDGRVDRVRLERDGGGLVGGPGWRWRVDGPDGVIGTARSLQSPPPPPPPVSPPRPPMAAEPGEVAPGQRPRPVDGIDEDGVPVHARSLVVSTARGPVTLVAEAPRAVVRQPIRAALLPLLSLLAALLILLVLAALLQLRIGLAPLRRLRDQVEAIRTGRLDRVEEDQPEELRPLAVELNALARDGRTALQAARRSGANLAHALKTPVAVLSLDLRDDPEKASQIARIDATIRHHLRRARIELADRRTETALGQALDGVMRAVRHLHPERSLLLASSGVDRLLVAIDAHDLDEMLGNLLDNAAAYARRHVWVHAGIDPADARRVRIGISDDGPGIPPSRRAQLLRPDQLLDQRGEGNGFGLAIVAELTALYAGTIALDERTGGGLLVELRLPGRAGKG